MFRLVNSVDTKDGTEAKANSTRVSVKHLDGCAHRIQYEAPFRLDAGQSFSVELRQANFAVAYTDTMPNW